MFYFKFVINCTWVCNLISLYSPLIWRNKRILILPYLIILYISQHSKGRYFYNNETKYTLMHLGNNHCSITKFCLKVFDLEMNIFTNQRVHFNGSFFYMVHLQYIQNKYLSYMPFLHFNTKYPVHISKTPRIFINHIIIKTINYCHREII